MRRFLLFTLFLCSAFLCVSCGLEGFTKIDPPYDAIPQNAADGVTVSSPTETEETRKFEFSSKENSSFIAPGTELYYRIYNSVEKLQEDARAVNTANTDVSGNGFYKIQSLSYKRLRTQSESKNQDLRIEGAHRVVVRLVDEGAFLQAVFYDGSDAAQFRPLLRDGDRLFYFKKEGSDTSLKNPVPGDTDFDSSGTESGYWYVNAYALSVGLVSSTWTRSVSKVLPLGFLAFKKEP